jgi:hypothetical protein
MEMTWHSSLESTVAKNHLGFVKSIDIEEAQESRQQGLLYKSQENNFPPLEILF